MRVELTDDLDTCRALRRTVFIDEQGVTEAEEWDGLDDQALHVLGWLDGTPVGTARMFIEGDTGKIGRVCVLAQARGTGAGAAMMARCLDAARAAGFAQCYLETLRGMDAAMRLYQRSGFHRIDGPMGATGHGSCNAFYLRDL